MSLSKSRKRERGLRARRSRKRYSPPTSRRQAVSIPDRYLGAFEQDKTPKMPSPCSREHPTNTTYTYTYDQSPLFSERTRTTPDHDFIMSDNPRTINFHVCTVFSRFIVFSGQAGSTFHIDRHNDIHAFHSIHTVVSMHYHHLDRSMLYCSIQSNLTLYTEPECPMPQTSSLKMGRNYVD